MSTSCDPIENENDQKQCGEAWLPDATDVVTEWLFQEHPDRLNHLNWNQDHAQYREYHKGL